MTSNNIKSQDYSIRIIESGPQIIEIKNNFLFENKINTPISPRRNNIISFDLYLKNQKIKEEMKTNF